MILSELRASAYRIAALALLALTASCTPSPMYMTPQQIAAATADCKRAGWVATLITDRAAGAYRQYVVCGRQGAP